MQTHIRRIGNSQGIIIPQTVLQQVGIERDIELQVINGAIVIRPAQVNLRADWDMLFQKAIEAGYTPENDMFDGVTNNFDQTEWQW